MKNAFKILSLCIIFLLSCTNVEPNEEGVLVSNYGKNGISDFTTCSGKTWHMAPGTTLYTVPMWAQGGDPAKMTVYAKGGGAFTVDPSYTYRAQRGKGRELIMEYKHIYSAGDAFFDNVEASTLNKMILSVYRDEAQKFTPDSLVNFASLYETRVKATIFESFQKKNFLLDELTSNLTPPQSMSNAIENKNLQYQAALALEQKKKTEQNAADIEIIQAETKLKVARLETQANRERTTSLTPAVLQQMWIEKWDGQLPNTMAGNQSGILVTPK